MLEFDTSSTIAAISTSIGEAGIGIVRLSGKQALNIADKIFISADKVKPSKFRSHTIHYGWIINNGKKIDEVLISVMLAPKTYTRENIVEINCHGGIVSLRNVLDLAIAKGARLAQKGEFTLRAFLNGRIDLSQEEAVLDLVKAKTNSSLDLSMKQLEGGLSEEINSLREDLLAILVSLEAQIDFPEEDALDSIKSDAKPKIKKALTQIENILSTASQGRILRDGINVVICGKPNVGKSSLLNMLLRQERAIVSPVAGTTRDTIEEFIDIKGIPLRFVDTAGIIEPRDLIEVKAISRTKQFLDRADLVLLVFDYSNRIDRQDKEIIKDVLGKKVIAVVNKKDLKKKIDQKFLKGKFMEVVYISAKENTGLADLESAIVRNVWKGKVVKSDNILVNNLRHIESLAKAKTHLDNALLAFGQNLSLEFSCLDVKLAIESLGEITGMTINEEVLERIFSDFCIGK